MAEPTPNSRTQHGGQGTNYAAIYVSLLVLLIVSVAGPLFGILWLTLATAFGIAFIKAALVVRNFMHLKWESRMVRWILAWSVVLMALFFAGVAPDVMRHEGTNWENIGAKEAVERGVVSEGEEAGMEN